MCSASTIPLSPSGSESRVDALENVRTDWLSSPKSVSSPSSKEIDDAVLHTGSLFTLSNESASSDSSSKSTSMKVFLTTMLRSLLYEKQRADEQHKSVEPQSGATSKHVGALSEQILPSAKLAAKGELE
jgi:hypothetical protein